MTHANGTGVVIWDATIADVSAICEIVRGMAEVSASPITEGYARAALERPDL